MNKFCFDIINPVTGEVFTRIYSNYDSCLENYLICRGADKIVGQKRDYKMYLIHATGAVYPLKPTKQQVLARYPWTDIKPLRMAVWALYDIKLPTGVEYDAQN